MTNKKILPYFINQCWPMRSKEIQEMLNTGRIPECELPNAVWYGLDDEGTLCVWDERDNLIACWEMGRWESFIGKGL